jgi:hypothetical protein
LSQVVVAVVQVYTAQVAVAVQVVFSTQLHNPLELQGKP